MNSDSLQSNEFSSLKISPELLTTIGELGFKSMTPIQEQAIPQILSGRDFIGQSKTGSGKTLAFSIPLLEKIDIRNRNVQALVLCPTRELCTQVAREIRRLGRHFPGLQVLTVCGGQPPKEQAMALAKGVHIVVGTPGRILDHLNRGRLDLNDVGYLVLDEADRMLDMGFEEDMEIILDEVPGTRQTAFFSATYPPTFSSLSQRHQHDPALVKIEDPSHATTSIQHRYCLTEHRDKVETLLKQLRIQRPESAFVFCNLKATVAELANTLADEGFSTDALHGDLEQIDRDRVMAKFRNGSTRILVATDVAARGLDVADLQMVICFDLPHQPADYVHRVGRTGRANKDGLALTLVTPREMMQIYEIEKYAGIKFEESKSDIHPAKLATSTASLQSAAMETLYISGGRKEKVRPGDILGALTGEAGGLNASEIGKIEIHDHFSYVAVTSQIAETALKRLQSGRIKGRRFLVKIAK